MPWAITTAWQIFCSIHREVEKNRYVFYGQADHKGGPPTPLTSAFRDVLVCAKKTCFLGQNFTFMEFMKLIIEKFHLFISGRLGVN